MTGGWPGTYYTGHTAASHLVQASVDGEKLVIRGDDPPLSVEWPTAEILLIGAPDKQGHLRLGRLNALERLTLQSAEALAELERQCPRLRASPYAGPGWRAVLLGCGGAIGAAAFLYFLALPFAARQATHWVSPRLEAEIGRQTADAVIRLASAAPVGKAECVTPAGLKALAHLMDPLTAQGTWSNAPRVRVINSPIVNAFALPGGQILLFRGILDFSAGPNEVAGVLAHELGHLALGHPIELAVERGGRSFLIGLLLGDVLGGSVIAGIGHAALEARYTRQAERAADARGLALLAGAGLDPRPFGSLFLRLALRQSADGATSFLADHPPNEERARLIADAPPGGRIALSDDDWKALKSICGD